MLDTLSLLQILQICEEGASVEDEEDSLIFFLSYQISIKGSESLEQLLFIVSVLLYSPFCSVRTQTNFVSGDLQVEVC